MTWGVRDSRLAGEKEPPLRGGRVDSSRERLKIISLFDRLSSFHSFFLYVCLLCD